MVKSNLVISITIKDEVVLNLVFTPRPAFQASRGKIAHSCQKTWIV